MFKVENHKPTFHIDVADRDEDDDGDEEDKPLTPVDKLKEKLDL